MFVTSFCMQCQAESGVPNFASTKAVVVPNDGVIEHKCDRGHLTYTLIDNPRYELLAQYAVVAMADGYYREGVASFASAYERLLEDFVRLTSRVRGIDASQFDTAWKPLSSLSERQLGAFSMVWLIETEEAFSHLPQKQVKLRNGVIHKGQIPSRYEAIGYGQAVIDCCRPIVEALHSERYEQCRVGLIVERSKARRERLRGHRVSSMGMPSPLGFDREASRFELSAHVAQRESGPKERDIAAFVSSSAPQLNALLNEATKGAGQEEG